MTKSPQERALPGVITFDHLIERLASLPRREQTLLVGIDGCGASGKSTFSKILQTSASNVTVVQMDDFYLPSTLRLDRALTVQQVGSAFDWPRVRKQVIEPLQKNEAGKYQRYDWDSDSLAEWSIVPVGGIVIVEGIYSTRRELAEFYDFKIWIDCPRQLRLARGLDRDGERARNIWENEWMPAEDQYVQSHKSDQAADLVVDGSALLTDERSSFVCRRGFGSHIDV